MINIIGRGEYFTLINVVDFDRFENLSLHEMSDTAFCHNRDRNSILDALDHFRVAHTGDAARCTDISRDTLQSHDCTCTCSFGDLCLFRCGDVHDNAAF